MAHFYGKIVGARGPASRLGSKASGLTVVAASWQGSVRTELYTSDGVDYARVALVPWQGVGSYAVLFDGPVAGLKSAEDVEA